LSKITDREKEILDLISRGYSTKEISEILYISDETVKSHRKNLFRKLNARNSANLIMNATRIGLLDKKVPINQ